MSRTLTSVLPALLVLLAGCAHIPDAQPPAPQAGNTAATTAIPQGAPVAPASPLGSPFTDRNVAELHGRPDAHVGAVDE